MLFECKAMDFYRQNCEIASFMTAYRIVQPTISAVKLTALYLNDSHVADVRHKAMALYHMKRGWHQLMDINMS